MRRRMRPYCAVMFTVILWGAVAGLAGPPLPTHQIEGNSGVFTTTTAYFANPPAEGELFGLPSVSGTFAAIGQKDFEAFAVTENIAGRFELGYSFERIGLGDWPEDVMAATGMTVDNHGLLHNFNGRFLAIPEGSFGWSLMPAVAVGAHLKVHGNLSDIDQQLGGACSALGADHTEGVEFTLVATKTFADLLPTPFIVSAGLRNGDAIHAGLLGFAGTRRTTVEGSVIFFLTNDLLIAAEYRQKPHLCSPLSVGGVDLVLPEDDWWDICLGWIVNDQITVAGGYANFGNILNHKEDNVWAIQIKYEF